MSFVDDLIARLNDIDKRLRHEEKLDKNPTPTGYGLLASTNTWTANNAFNSTATSGTALSVTRNLTATSTDSPVVSIVQDHASDDQVALYIQQDGAGATIEAVGSNAKSSGTLSTPLTLHSNDSAATALTLLYQINGNATAGSRYTSIHSVEQGTGYRALVLNPNADVMAVILRAFSAAGLTITDDGGNLGIFVEDGGKVGIGTNTPAATETFSRLTVAGTDNTAFYAAVINAGTGQVGFALNRTGGTTSRWVMYVPGASDFLSIFSGTLGQGVLGLTATGQTLAGNITSAGASKLGIQAGTSTNDAAAGGVLYVDSSTRSNSSTTETDLASYSVPANTLSANNMSLSMLAWGTLTNAAATKTVKFYFGATAITLFSAGGVASTWTVRARIIRTGAATQDVLIEAVGTGFTAVTITTAAETLSGAVTLKLTGQGGASTQISQEGMIIEFLDQNT